LTQHADGSISDPNADKFIPAERHKDLFHAGEIPRRPNYGKPPEGKPALQRKIADLPPLGPNTVTDDESIRNRLRMLASADEGLGEMLRVLEQQGQLENTLVVYTSDEGYFYGEHGLSTERRLAYEESARIPLYMRVPKSIERGKGPGGRPGSVIAPFVVSIDVAPTFLEIAGAPPANDMDGRSLMPLLRGDKVDWRESFLIEYFSDRVFPRVANMGYQAVRTDRWSYIHYVDLEGMDELYDLHADPYQMNNLIAEPSAQSALQHLKEERDRLLRDSS
jgi:N-acetylglucosamine-6-sulfatase